MIGIQTSTPTRGGEPIHRVVVVRRFFQTSSAGFEHRRMAVGIARLLRASPPFFRVYINHLITTKKGR